eukprot:UN32158
MTDDGWNVVKPKKNKRKRVQQNLQPKIVEPFSKTAFNDVTDEVKKLVLEFKQKAVFTKLKRIFQTINTKTGGIKISSMICLGIGSISRWDTTQQQLALLILMVDYFKIERSNVRLFDPLFNNVDQNILKKFGFSVDERNEEGKIKITKQTLVYMPHCPLSLYENIIRSNWNKSNLTNIILIGNRLNDISAAIEKETCIKKCCKICT